MGKTDQASRMEQSRNITRIGCMGLALLFILLILIGGIAVRADVQKLKTKALGDLGKMRTQIDKVPGILGRMVEFGCGEDARLAEENVSGIIESLESDAGFDRLEQVWDEIDDAYDLLYDGCRKYQYERAFDDLKTEMEGVRNRYSVEKGNYRKSSEAYNAALGNFPADFFAFDFEQL